MKLVVSGFFAISEIFTEKSQKAHLIVKNEFKF